MKLYITFPFRGFFNLKKSSFCALGKSIPLPFESLIKKVK